MENNIQEIECSLKINFNQLLEDIRSTNITKTKTFKYLKNQNIHEVLIRNLFDYIKKNYTFFAECKPWPQDIIKIFSQNLKNWETRLEIAEMNKDLHQAYNEVEEDAKEYIPTITKQIETLIQCLHNAYLEYIEFKGLDIHKI